MESFAASSGASSLTKAAAEASQIGSRWSQRNQSKNSGEFKKRKGKQVFKIRSCFPVTINDY